MSLQSNNMIEEFYHLAEQPFGVTPDTRYLYFSPTHREALASLLYSVQTGRGFTSLIAQPGMGKTILLFKLLQQLRDSVRTVFLFQTMSEPADLLRSLLSDLGAETAGRDISQLQAQLNGYLLAESFRGRRIVVVLDEAQHLSDSALELVRMFSNFETPHEKLMHIILAGQPQLAERLALPHLVQLRQRISVIARLHPFSLQETEQYIAHRLRAAGYTARAPLFTKGATGMIAEHSGGIPRNINNICFNALALGCVQRQKTINESVIGEVLEDLDLRSLNEPDRVARPVELYSEAGRLPSFARAYTPGLTAWLPKFVFGGTLLAALVLCGIVAIRRGSVASPAQRIARASEDRGIIQAKPGVVSSSRTESQGERSPVPPDDLSSVEGLAAPKANPATVDPGDPSSAPRTPLPALKAPKRPASAVTQLNTPPDPAELWDQVRAERTPAEVTLAKLYIEGNVVPQNCPQALVLLSVASRKGNKDAQNVLADDYARLCR